MHGATIKNYFLDIIYLERNAKFINYTFCPVTTKSNKRRQPFRMMRT